MENPFRHTLTAATGVNYTVVDVYASEMTSRTAISSSLGCLYDVDDYVEDMTRQWDRWSPADCWVQNISTGHQSLWELKSRPDIRLSTYEDGFIRVKKVKKLADMRKRRPSLDVWIGLIYPLDKAVVMYPLDSVLGFNTKEVEAWDPDKGKYVKELNYLCPVRNIDRVHDLGGHIRHWGEFDWDRTYSMNLEIGQELSSLGLI